MTVHTTLDAWFDGGIKSGHSHMLIVFYNSIYVPWYVNTVVEYTAALARITARKERVGYTHAALVEVYDLSRDRDAQFEEECAYHPPQPLRRSARIANR